MTVNYEYYRIFYMVAETQNITLASQRLFLSQSTVSRSIQNLERALDCPLLVRNQKGCSLTSDGQYLYECLQQAVPFISAAEEHLLKRHALQEGTLRIGVTEITQEFLVYYLEVFHQAFPNVQSHFSFQYPDQAMRLLNEGELDVAVMTTPLEKAEHIKSISLKDFDNVLIAGSAFREYFDREICLQDVAHLPFVLMERGSSARAYLDSVLKQYDVRMRQMVEAGSMSLILRMVEYNIGIGFIPEVYAEEELQSGRVTKLLLRNPLPTQTICVLTSDLYPGNRIKNAFLAKLLH